MGLATGARVGSYEVLGSLGAGGMGEVYRARDLKLDRDVALKILPSAFAADPDRLARFEREAKTLAALNHPLIAQIWSPNGERVAFQSDREGDLAIFAQRADGTGSVERLTKPENGVAHIPESWSPDGRFVSLSVVKDSTYALSVLTVSDRMVAPFGNVQSFEPPGSVFSPDGRWLAYHALGVEERQRGIGGGTFVQTFPASDGIYPAPNINRDFQPLWSHDGKELFYVPLASNGRIAAVRVMAQSGLTFGIPETFPAAVIAGRTSGLRRAFDVLPDGKLVGPVSADQAVGEAGTESEIRIVLNWFEEL